MAAGNAHTEELIGMAEITVVVGSVGLGAAGLVAWYTKSQRRAVASLKRIPVRVRTARSAPALRRGAE